MKKKSKKKFVIWTLIGLFASALFTGYLFMPKGASDLEEEKAETGDIITYYSFSGTVEAKNRKTMMSDTAIQIKEIEVEVGEEVEKGDVLLTTKQGDKLRQRLDGRYPRSMSRKTQKSCLEHSLSILSIIPNYKPT